MDHNDNISRALGEVVAIKAWSKAHRYIPSRADVHVVVHFSEATIGQEQASQITFRMALKGAEVMLILGEKYGLGIDPSSVDRSVQRRIHVTEANSSAEGREGALKRAASPKTTIAKATGLLWKILETAKNAIKTSDRRAITMEHWPPKRGGSHIWRLTPAGGDILEGAVWDAAGEKRFSVIDKRSDERRQNDKDMGFPPTITIAVRCRREDMLIYDIRRKGEEYADTPTHRGGIDRRLAAAEAYIKQRLFEEGLDIANPNDAVGQFTLDEYLMSFE